MTAPGIQTTRHTAESLRDIEIAADRARAARDREARRRAEDALDGVERRALRDEIADAEHELLRCATSQATCATARVIRCGTSR